MAETRRASNLGPLALAVRDEPTLRHALSAAARYNHLQNEALFISVEEEANVAIVREERVFTRWFRSRFGCSPGQYKAKELSPRAGRQRKPAAAAPAKRKNTG
ncbi:AraC family transcriptional regulator ligand-binding domain-containing protein [Paraburkholderia sp. J63]|uniref:AraC family transcriptional regulator ligand-binding domain-containing protein n=1 Tax=Paraburkholderia sp. J63 TaxID=2805434 RepID=UPI002ABDFED4|nr:AraC family transcriptional regulator ligand-binding domain-containing protein [Paraburkholderia sp. J63]